MKLTIKMTLIGLMGMYALSSCAAEHKKQAELAKIQLKKEQETKLKKQAAAQDEKVLKQKKAIINKGIRKKIVAQCKSWRIVKNKKDVAACKELLFIRRNLARLDDNLRRTIFSFLPPSIDYPVVITVPSEVPVTALELYQDKKGVHIIAGLADGSITKYMLSALLKSGKTPLQSQILLRDRFGSPTPPIRFLKIVPNVYKKDVLSGDKEFDAWVKKCKENKDALEQGLVTWGDKNPQFKNIIEGYINVLEKEEDEQERTTIDQRNLCVGYEKQKELLKKPDDCMLVTQDEQGVVGVRSTTMQKSLRYSLSIGHHYEVLDIYEDDRNHPIVVMFDIVRGADGQQIHHAQIDLIDAQIANEGMREEVDEFLRDAHSDYDGTVSRIVFGGYSLQLNCSFILGFNPVSRQFEELGRYTDYPIAAISSYSDGKDRKRAIGTDTITFHKGKILIINLTKKESVKELCCKDESGIKKLRAFTDAQGPKIYAQYKSGATRIWDPATESCTLLPKKSEKQVMKIGNTTEGTFIVRADGRAIDIHRAMPIPGDFERMYRAADHKPTTQSAERLFDTRAHLIAQERQKKKSE
jgi:hypothetical protein